jgi:RNA polymerase-binding protein DksA
MTEQVNGIIAAQELQSLLDLIDEREEELRTRIAGEKERATAEMTSQLDGVVGDGADYAGARIRAGIENELVDRHTRDLAALAAARQRIDAGTYGTCADCAEPIGVERLRANPVALRCAGCQTVRERGALLTPR